MNPPFGCKDTPIDLGNFFKLKTFASGNEFRINSHESLLKITTLVSAYSQLRISMGMSENPQ
jgi:hypothetical protein